MKTLLRISVLTAMLMVLGGVAHTQISLGFRGGINLAKWQWEIENESADEYMKNMPAPYFSLPVEYKITNGFAIQLEPGFIQQGTRTYIEDESPSEGGTQLMIFDARTKINYFFLPALAKGVLSTGKFRLYLMGGPQLAYAFDGKVKTEETTIINGESTTEKYSEKIDWSETFLSRFDFGVTFAGGVEFSAGPGSIVFDARYLLGLQNLDKEKDDLIDQKIYNRGIGLTVGYMVPLGN